MIEHFDEHDALVDHAGDDHARYYEEQGLLPAGRGANGYRDYGEQAVQVVAFIQDLYHAGPPSEIIRQILPCAGSDGPQGDCTELLARVAQVRDQLAHQEQHLALRREMLERYLSGAATPAGLDAHLNRTPLRAR